MPGPIFQDPRFDALRNAIYHTARGRHLEARNRWLNLFVILAGTATVAKTASAEFSVPNYLPELAVVVIATLQLVFDYGGRASTHLFLQKRYYDLLADMEADPASDFDPKKWSVKLLTIAGEEPLTMRALDAIAYNSALDSLISDPDVLKEHRLYVPWWRRWSKQFLAFPGTQFLPSSNYVSWPRRISIWWNDAKKATE